MASSGEIARDILVAALQCKAVSVGAGGKEQGTKLGEMYAELFKIVEATRKADAEASANELTSPIL